jgi:hypothetical protein
MHTANTSFLGSKNHLTTSLLQRDFTEVRYHNKNFLTMKTVLQTNVTKLLTICKTVSNEIYQQNITVTALTN